VHNAVAAARRAANRKSSGIERPLADEDHAARLISPIGPFSLDPSAGRTRQAAAQPCHAVAATFVSDRAEGAARRMGQARVAFERLPASGQGAGCSTFDAVTYRKPAEIASNSLIDIAECGCCRATQLRAPKPCVGQAILSALPRAPALRNSPGSPMGVACCDRRSCGYCA
jgi:hypothetical protein